MPTIPTFTARGRPTAESASVVSNIKVNVNQSVAAALRPLGKSAEDYYIKKRNTEEKLVADKALLEIQSESDKIIYSLKDDVVEEDAINNYKQKFTSIVNQKTSTIQNKRIKQLIATGVDLDNSENIYNIKKNSFIALEKDSLTNVNNKITSFMSKYATTDDSRLKFIYKENTKNTLKSYAKDFNLPKNVLDQKLKAADRDFLLSDINQFAGLANGAEEIKNLDNSLKGTNFLNDGDFGVGVFNAYNAKISELTIKGDPNADYDRALELSDELEEFKRSNGYEVSTGDLSIKIDSLKQKVLTEKIQHDGLIQKQGDNKLFFGYSNDLRDALVKDIADPFGDPELQDRIASAEIESEYNETIKNYLIANQDASLPEKKDFSRSLIFSLRNIYEDRRISNLNTSILDQNQFDIQGEYQRVLNDINLYAEGKLNEDVLKQYKTLAKLNGYIIKGEDGTKEGDFTSFINEYLPLLKSQVSITLTGQ
tara:strand:+ start:321 stop:1766 length:1446 start_codon:yes stop_codon:yes gene_type:complete